jgi:hypothetical protein
MTAERLLAWTAAVAAVAVAWVGATAGVPTLPERTVVVGLGTLACLPLAVVAVIWLVSVGNSQRGWN